MRSISGALDIAGTPAVTYGEGRICGYDGCRTVLSRYNPGSYCAAHEALEPPDCWLYYKPCSVCGEVKHAAVFEADETRWDRRGEVCSCCRRVAEIEAARRAKRKVDHRKLRAVLRVVPTVMRCRQCGAEKPFDDDHFRGKANGSRSHMCLECSRRIERERYYQKRYGMTRQEFREALR